MKELLENAEEFFESGEDNLNKNRFNAAGSDFFKTIVILCDYLIYKETRSLPKNHSERFIFLKRYFKEIYVQVSKLFTIYTDSYNLKLSKEDAINIRSYANELKKYTSNKK